ncbi:trypsin-like peptidase domain-containing protein [Mycoplasmatota bacterium WC30]
MKIKKTLILLLITMLMSVLVSCDLRLDFLPTTTTTKITELSSLPTPTNGTLTFEDTNYNDLPTYISPTYSLTNIDAYNNVLYATQDFVRQANIEVVNTTYNDRGRTEATSSGSGFIFLEDDNYFYAITNNHVIDPGEFTSIYSITIHDGLSSSATLLATDPDLDLAVLRFEKLLKYDVTIINIYERLYYKFNRGELVIAVGNPLNVTNNVTFGEFKGMEDISNADYSVLYHDAKIYAGSSGGALVDVDGNLLGVNTWGTGESEPYSFAIPNYIVYIFLVNYGILD